MSITSAGSDPWRGWCPGRGQVTSLGMGDTTYSKAHFPWHHIQGQKEESRSVLARWQKTAGGGCPHGGLCPSVLRQKRW